MRFFPTNMGLALLLAFTLLGGPPVAWAQGLGADPEEVPVSPSRESARTFGIAASTSHTVQASAFTVLTSAVAVTANGFGSRFCSSVDCSFEAAAFLPAGAVLERLELEACDTSATAGLGASLFRVGALETSFVTLAALITGVAATPGCAFFGVPLATPESIDNFNNTYQVRVSITAAGSATRFQAVRLFYRLQVSPAPATATFGDVPTTHPFFQFIEALAEAGITSGCQASPPLYCPDGLVTRGQMAAFISRALGLQFAP